MLFCPFVSNLYFLLFLSNIFFFLLFFLPLFIFSFSTYISYHISFWLLWRINSVSLIKTTVVKIDLEIDLLLLIFIRSTGCFVSYARSFQPSRTKCFKAWLSRKIVFIWILTFMIQLSFYQITNEYYRCFNVRDAISTEHSAVHT